MNLFQLLQEQTLVFRTAAPPASILGIYHAVQTQGSEVLSVKNYDSSNVLFINRLKSYIKSQQTSVDVHKDHTNLLNTPRFRSTFKTEWLLSQTSQCWWWCVPESTLKSGVLSDNAQKQKIQKGYFKGMFSIISAIEKGSSTEIKNVLMDWLTLIPNANMNFNFRRRAEMKLERKRGRLLPRLHYSFGGWHWRKHFKKRKGFIAKFNETTGGPYSTVKRPFSYSYARTVINPTSKKMSQLKQNFNYFFMTRR